MEQEARQATGKIINQGGVAWSAPLWGIKLTSYIDICTCQPKGVYKESKIDYNKAVR